MFAIGDNAVNGSPASIAVQSLVFLLKRRGLGVHKFVFFVLRMLHVDLEEVHRIAASFYCNSQTFKRAGLNLHLSQL